MTGRVGMTGCTGWIASRVETEARWMRKRAIVDAFQRLLGRKPKDTPWPLPADAEKPSITLPFKHNNKNMRGVLRFNLPRATSGGRIMIL